MIIKIDTFQPVDIYSIIVNTKMFVDKKNRNIRGIEYITDRTKRWYNLKQQFIVNSVKVIFNMIIDNKFSLLDFRIYILYIFIYKESFSFNFDNEKLIKNILEVKQIFSNEQFEIDKQVILNLSKKFHFKNIHEIIEIDDNGISVIYNLIIKKYISPMIFIGIYNEIYNVKGGGILEELKKKNKKLSNEYIRFIRIIDRIEDVLINAERVKKLNELNN